MKIKDYERAYFLRGGPRGFRAGGDAPRPYIGDEFCERRLPADGQLAGLRGAGVFKGGKFTLVTPPLTDRGLARAKAVIKRLAAYGPGFEVVINDWGLLDFLGGFGGKLSVVLGRVLTNRHARSMIFDEFNPEFLAFALKRGIRRMEFNQARHLLAARPQLNRKGIKAHFYTPYSFMTWSRFCRCAVQFRDDAESSRSRCSRACEKLYGTSAASDGRTSLEITIRGNAYLMDSEIPAGRGEMRVDRLVEDGLF